VTLLGVAFIGLGIGFLGGLFGKGGSAVATPLLHLIGVPAIVAIAAPLPATIPSTLVAGRVYRRERLVDARVAAWCIVSGLPAAVLGALSTKWIDGALLVRATDVVLVGLGVRFVTRGHEASASAVPPRPAPVWLLLALGMGVGVVSGLLANSGGFLLAPLFVAVLAMPIHSAFATSLAVSAVLAIPGTIVHAALGHLDLRVVAVFAVTSVPLAAVGARVAVRSDAATLERVYGAVIASLGTALLAVG